MFEMTSVQPMGRYARGLERLGVGSAARRFYDVHVLADAQHEHQALDMIDAFAGDEPARADDVIFGAASALVVERALRHRRARLSGPHGSSVIGRGAGG